MIKIKIIISAIGLGFLVFNEVGIIKLISLYNNDKVEQRELNQKYAQITQLTGEIDKLENDPEYIKKIAREEFLMAEEGEKIYRVENQKYIQKK